MQYLANRINGRILKVFFIIVCTVVASLFSVDSFKIVPILVFILIVAACVFLLLRGATFLLIYILLSYLGFIFPVFSYGVFCALIIGIMIVTLPGLTPNQDSHVYQKKEFVKTLYFVYGMAISISVSLFWSSLFRNLTSDIIISSLRFIALTLVVPVTYLITLQQKPQKMVTFHLASVIIFILLFFIMFFIHGTWITGRLSISNRIHPNQLAMIFELTFPVTFFCAINEKRKLKKIFLFAFFILLQSLILLTYSKGALIAISSCFIFAIFYRPSLKKTLIFIIFAGFLSSFFFEGYYKRSSLKSLDNIMSSGTRVELQRSSLKAILDNGIIVGAGIDGFKFEKYYHGFPKYLDPDKSMSSHNAYLEILYGSGIIGLFVFLSVIIMTIYSLCRYNTKKDLGIKFGLMFALICYSIHALFDSNILSASYLFILFFTIGVSLALCEKKSEVCDVNLKENNGTISKEVYS